MKIKLSTIFYPTTEGGYTVTCPEIGWTTQGETYEEAQTHMQELIKDYFANEGKEEKSDYQELYSSRIFRELEIEV